MNIDDVSMPTAGSAFLRQKSVEISVSLSWNIYCDPLLRRIRRLVPGVRVRFAPRRRDGADTADDAATAGSAAPAEPLAAVHLEEAPERAFADDIVIYLDFQS